MNSTEQERRIHKLNQKFAEFGRNPQGFLRFQWKLSQDMFYLLEDGRDERRVQLVDDPNASPSGLLLPNPELIVFEKKYERHSFADLYGKDRFFVAMWREPIPHDLWLQQVGTAFPWPKHGEYMPIESTVLPEGMEPDEDLTVYACFKIAEAIGLPYRQHLDRVKDKIAMKQKREQGAWEDEVDDVMPAYGNVPGRKEHVSFPGVTL